MKHLAASLLGAWMVIYFVYRALTMAAFGLLAGVLFDRHYGIYSFLLMSAAAAAIVLTFLDRKRWGALSAAAVGLTALLFWFFNSCWGLKGCSAIDPSWSYFKSGVIPELIFAVAGVGRWLLEPRHEIPIQAEAHPDGSD